MPKPSPFHARTKALCTSYRWKSWAGYHSVCSYDICHEREYNAFRQAAGLIDVSPLYKYDIHGADAAAFLTRVTTRNLHALKMNRVVYLCWTDDHGKIIDDGTCARLDENHFRITAAEPMYHWFIQHADGFDVEVVDTSTSLAALALQGPTARLILNDVCDRSLNQLKFFGLARTRLNGVDCVITRTGYTGDLGYEVWMPQADALPVWDALMEGGRPHGIHPAGLDALDVCRIEAGFIMMGVDYTGAFHAVIDSQKSTPYELGLGWTVNPDHPDPFIGQRALRNEKKVGAAWALVGLDISWEATEALYDEYELPPALSANAWRTPVPIYGDGRQIGRATSGVWSPILKKNLALATVESGFSSPGTVVDIEVTVEWARRTVPAMVVTTPFFDPARKKAVIDDV
ncbi:MAG: aminomethyltransferase family protein [Myxococcota bacterium]|nr:aminomethyltransferase family protein [Myxococcota bacterium]